MRKLIIDMQGKRVFSTWLDAEYEGMVNDSIVEIRGMLSEGLKAMPEGSGSYASVSAMREACNEYLQATPDPIQQGLTHLRPHFRRALQRWRDTVKLELQSIAHALDLDEARTLARSIPTEVKAFPQVSPGPARDAYAPPPDWAEDPALFHERSAEALDKIGRPDEARHQRELAERERHQQAERDRPADEGDPD
jgi:hypothetical protein